MFGRRKSKRNQRGSRYKIINVELGAAQQRSKRLRLALKWGGSILRGLAQGEQPAQRDPAERNTDQQQSARFAQRGSRFPHPGKGR